MTDNITKVDDVWDIGRLTPYAMNSKKHDAKQVGKIAASIAKFGWTTRIVVEPDGTIIAGHGRRLAAIDLMQEKVPVTVLKGITKEQAKALRLIDNKVQEGGYDTTMLSLELKELVLEDGFHMGEFFDARDLNFAIDDLGDLDLGSLTEDIAPQVQALTERTEDEIEQHDDNGTSLARALGFSKVTGAQAREFKRVLGLAMDKFGLEPGESFLAAMQDWAAIQLNEQDDGK